MCLYVVSIFTLFLRDLEKLSRIRAVLSSDNDHRVRFLGDLKRFTLSYLCGIANRIHNSDIIHHVRQ